MTTKELTEAFGEQGQRITKVEGQVENHDRTIEAIRKEQKEQATEIRELGRLMITIERLATAMETVKDNVTKIDTKLDRVCVRVEEIEHKPGKKWELLGNQMLILVVGVVGGYLLNLILK